MPEVRDEREERDERDGHEAQLPRDRVASAAGTEPLTGLGGVPDLGTHG